MRNMIGALIAVGVLTACSSTEEADTETAAATTEIAAVTVAPTTTPASTSTTTTTEKTTTTTTEAVTTSTAVADTTTPVAPEGPNFGLVWQSSADPERINTTDGRPAGDADGIRFGLDMVLTIDASADGELGDECREQISIFESTGATSCLLAQWRFDVDPSFRTDSDSPEGGLSCGDTVTSDGKQVTGIFVTTGYPGTKDNILSCVYPFAGFGSTVHWETGSNLVGYTSYQYTVPTLMPTVRF